MSSNNDFNAVEDRFRPRDPNFDRDDQPLPQDYEELYPIEERELEPLEQLLLIFRCFTLLVFLFGFMIVVLNIFRGNRLKNWRLYLVVAFSLLVWLVLSLYQDHIDQYFVHAIYRFPQSRSIYWCFRNLVHGITLYLVVLLLSHLADFQRRGLWLALVFATVGVPLVYAITVLIVDLRVPTQSRFSWEWNVGLSTFRVFLYNVVTSVLLVVFGVRFCTGRLYGTYSERRSSLVVCVARTTYALLLLHNLTAIASYAATVAAVVPGLTAQPVTASTVHQVLEEVLLLLAVIGVPGSYVLGILSTCCCGCCGGDDGEEDRQLEMDKVWTTNGDQKRKGSKNTAGDPLGLNPAPQRHPTTPSANPAGASANTSISARHPQLPRAPSSGYNGSLAGSIGGASDLSLNRTTDGGPSTNPNPGATSSAAAQAEKRRKRESYMEAVSNSGADDRGSVSSNLTYTSEPVDL